jgi:hypothetical protein
MISNFPEIILLTSLSFSSSRNAILCKSVPILSRRILSNVEISDEIFNFSFMNIEIDEKTITETTRCDCNFKCLHDYLDRCCEVEKYDNALLIFLKCLGSKYCIYKKFMGFSSFSCTCPTRIAIFNKLAV